MYTRPPRFSDWPTRLANFVQTRALAQFEWGVNDCCSFAGDAVQLMTGTDPMRSLRGRYATAQGAQRLIKSAGGLQPLVCRYMGAPMEFVAMAARGDVVMVPVSDTGPALGICLGSEAALPGLDKLVIVKMQVAQAAWRV